MILDSIECSGVNPSGERSELFDGSQKTSMRLFVSVGAESISGRIETVQEPLTGLEGIRLTDLEQAHVTVKFLGERDVGSFEATLEGVGAFPSPEYIRVVWLGFEAGREPLTELHRRVEAETTALGYDEESHDFTPHVTLARMDNAAAKSDVQRFLEERDPIVGTIDIDALRLTESTLTPDGPEYRTVQRFEL